MKQRSSEILRLVNDRQRISVKELAEHMQTSMVTIRKDLEELEQQGFLRRLHGYAERMNTDAIDGRMAVRYPQKLAIANAAVQLVSPMETVMIESGSTCALFARALAAVNDVTVITNSGYIARFLHHVAPGRVILLGGDYDAVSETTSGPVTRLCAQEYHVDKLFVGIDGYTDAAGFTNVNHTRCTTVREIARQAAHVIVLSTSDKFGKRSVARLFDAQEVSMVVTDTQLPQAYRTALEEKQVRVLLAGADGGIAEP